MRDGPKGNGASLTGRSISTLVMVTDGCYRKLWLGVDK
jgi:hypothetical protein